MTPSKEHDEMNNAKPPLPPLPPIAPFGKESTAEECLDRARWDREWIEGIRSKGTLTESDRILIQGHLRTALAYEARAEELK